MSGIVHRWAVATAACTFLLLLVGGIVHGTGSSLACPDWPLCYGDIAPPMTGGIFYEHGHRLLATGVGMMTIALFTFCVRARHEDGALPWLGWAALVIVIIQGVLGGLTVIFRLPTAVSTGHLATSMVYFALLLTLAWRARRGEPEARTWPVAPGVRRLAGVSVAAVFIQIVIGALVRHTGAGLACLDVPLCAGELWPAAAHVTAKLQMVHRIAGVLVAAVVVASAVQTFRAAPRSARGIRLLAGAAPVLVAIQIVLGALSVWSMLGLWQVTAHLGVGALLLADVWLLRLATRAADPAAARAPSMALEQVRT